jgi:hypothetical protein
MKQVKILVGLLIVLLLNGCAGSGFTKKTTLMPDQVKFEVDLDPQDNYNAKEITGGFVWKLK